MDDYQEHIFSMIYQQTNRKIEFKIGKHGIGMTQEGVDKL